MPLSSLAAARKAQRASIPEWPILRAAINDINIGGRCPVAKFTASSTNYDKRGLTGRTSALNFPLIAPR